MHYISVSCLTVYYLSACALSVCALSVYDLPACALSVCALSVYDLPACALSVCALSAMICLLVHYLSVGCLKRGFTRVLYCLIEISLLFNPFLCFDFISVRWQSALFHI